MENKRVIELSADGTQRMYLQMTHAVIFTQNGAEKVRLLKHTISSDLTEENARKLLLERFGIVADEIIQIG